MLGRTTGAVLVGIEAHLISVEVHLAGGLPRIVAVGLPDAAVREGIDRVRSALSSAGLPLPDGRIVVSLAPAAIRKQGAGLDLPIALALLAAARKVDGARLKGHVLAGELGLDGSLRPVRGALSMALAARAAGHSALVVPPANAEEASLVPEIDVVPASSLADALAAVRGERPARRGEDVAARLAATRGEPREDLAEVRGQATARRALEIAAAGGHHLLFEGPPGAGKTMLARRMPGILPELGPDEALEVTRVWSAAGLTRSLLGERPFRAPHHGVSFAGMTGGGPLLRPGEISLSNHGVLFLDEMNEFRRDVLEALRQPLEDRVLRVVRVHADATFPAAFTLVGSMNPCPCGWHGAPDGRCRCAPSQVQRYRNRVSGPLLDRFDLVVGVPPVDLDALGRGAPGEASAKVRERVAEARAVQRKRFRSTGNSTNAGMRPRELDAFVALDDDARRLLRSAAEKLGLSARGYDRVRRVARTVADLEGRRAVGPRHVGEALQYRPSVAD